MIFTQRKGFTIIEIILVIIIIMILFLASRNLFQAPNKYLIDSEVCVNTVYGQLSQFFYQWITGKDKTINWISHEPNSYWIQISRWTTGYSSVWLYISTGWNYIQESRNHISTTGSSVIWCNSQIYTVMLSWVNLKNNWENISVFLNKDLQNSLGSAGMRICKNYDFATPGVCNRSFSEKIDFLICKKNTNWTIDIPSCKHTFSTRFDTTTQSIKSNRCLNIIYEGQCKKRSVDNF